jgi:hypothetical protein
LIRSVPSSRWSSSPSRPATIAQEAAALGGVEVADRAAEKGDQSRPARRRQTVEVALEVADQPVHVQAGILRGQLGGTGANHLLGHVHGDEALERPGGGHRIQQQARLGRAARSQLDELAGAGRGDQLVGDALEDRPLGAGRVVLGQLADPVEQHRAARVVEVLWRQLLERAGQAVASVVGERAPAVARQRVLERHLRRGRADRLGAHPSAATRRPAKICRRLG